LERLAYILPLAACVYLIVSCWWVRSFFARANSAGDRTGAEAWEARRPAVIGADPVPPCTPVSVLKPVRGLDPGAYDNLSSFCRQDYEEYEVLFAAADPHDPVIPVIEQIARESPPGRVRLITGVPQPFANPKVNSLAALTAAAVHPLLAISDSDMRVDATYLGRVTAPMVDPEVGMVTCCYRGAAPVTMTAKLEALHMGVTFLPEVVVARRFLDMHFALGATMVVRSEDLEDAGGWKAVGDFLAEDTLLARQIRQRGKKVLLSDYIVDSYLGFTTWREQWHREVRWARTNRVNRPREYAGMLLTLPFPLALVFLPLNLQGALGWSVLAAALVVRWATAWLITGYTDNRALRRWLAWLPLRDLLSAATWCAGVAGRTVVWRGQVHRLHPDGRLDPVCRIGQIATDD
jgi:ceramide glucosyltransferase